MVFNTLWETTLQQHIPPASLSRVSAYDWFGSLLCQPLGLALAGPVAALGSGWARRSGSQPRPASPLSLRCSLAPSVRHLQRLDEPELEQSAQQLVAD